MKGTLLISFALSAFISCNTTSEKTNQQKTISKQFFEYDEIDYYFNNYDELNVKFLEENRSRSEIDSLKYEVILGDIPKDIDDLYFINKLNDLGFSKRFVDRSNFSSIDSLFKEKTVKMPVWLTCIHLYRDILIFKKQNTVVGIAKICCMANQIRGTNANTENFGQEGDYEKLEKILRE